MVNEAEAMMMEIPNLKDNDGQKILEVKKEADRLPFFYDSSRLALLASRRSFQISSKFPPNQ